MLLSVFAQPASPPDTNIGLEAVWLSVGGEQHAAWQLARLELRKSRPPMLGLRWQARVYATAAWLRVRTSEVELKQRLAESLYFGRGAHGLEAAAGAHFGLRLDELSLGETVLLAGLVYAPGAYDPACHPERARERQRYVLGRLVAEQRITATQYLEALGEPVRTLPLSCPPRSRAAAHRSTE